MLDGDDSDDDEDSSENEDGDRLYNLEELFEALDAKQALARLSINEVLEWNDEAASAPYPPGSRGIYVGDSERTKRRRIQDLKARHDIGNARGQKKSMIFYSYHFLNFSLNI